MKLVLFSSSRADAGIIQPVADALKGCDAVSVVRQTIDINRGDGGVDVADASAETIATVARGLRTSGAEALLLAGDRTETLAAALAATCMRVPLIHLHGGETSWGAIDEGCRHAISKLAALHCVAHPDFADRLLRMGERESRIFITGAPSLDAAWKAGVACPALPAGWPLILLTMHPSTLSDADEIDAVLAGIRLAWPDAGVVATAPNNDSGRTRILLALLREQSERFIFHSWLGTEAYHALLSRAQVVVGNSSSGILEAPTFGVPVVNVGDRQRGRLQIAPTWNCPADIVGVARCLTEAVSGRTVGTGPRPPRVTAYNDGHAAERVRDAIISFAKNSPFERLDKSRHLP